MADNRSKGKTTQPPDPGIGTPSQQQRTSDILHVEVAKIQADGEHIKRDLSDVRSDMKEVRERLVRVEVRVDHLPTKGFIVTTLIAALTIASLLVALAPQLQRLAGSAVHKAVGSSSD